MKTNKKTNDKWKKQRGFTLIEMVVVLAIIAVLAAIVAPKGVKAIHDAKINSVPTAVATLKTAETQYAVKNDGSLPVSEAVLLSGKIITTSVLKSIKIGTAAALTLPAGNASGLGATKNGYDLDSNGTADTLATEKVSELTVGGLSLGDANAIDLALDGFINPAMGRVESQGTAGVYTVAILIDVQ